MTCLLSVTQSEHIPDDPRSLDPTIDRDLVTICSKCLEKEPADRYPAVSELARDVKRYLEGATISAKPRSAMQQLVDWCESTRWLRHCRGCRLSCLWLACYRPRFSGNSRKPTKICCCPSCDNGLRMWMHPIVTPAPW